jgi:DNA polymerase
MDALALLRLQVEWGADEALDVDPVDRLMPVAAIADKPPSRPAIAPPALREARPSAVSALSPAERALAAAGQAETIDALGAAISAFDGCPLRHMATNTVLAAGDPSSGLLIVGEAPGADEDREGAPFKGLEGELLDKMLGSIGLDRHGLLLAPLIPWRPPGGRPPNASELAVCLPFLHRLIALADPRRMVILGGLAARALLKTPAGRRNPRPVWTECALPGSRKPIPAVALPGLAMLLKNPLLRRDAWAGVRLLRKTLDSE